MRLIPASDEDFQAMISGAASTSSAHLPIDGVDSPTVLQLLQRSTASMLESGFQGTWMMVDEKSIVVGLCGFKGIPTPVGLVEVGYGVAPAFRRRGHATAAVSKLITIAQDLGLSAIMAKTEHGNRASERVLEKNGFHVIETQPTESSEVSHWRRTLL